MLMIGRPATIQVGQDYLHYSADASRPTALDGAHVRPFEVCRLQAGWYHAIVLTGPRRGQVFHAQACNLATTIQPEGHLWPVAYADIWKSPQVTHTLNGLFPWAREARKNGCCPICRQPVTGQDTFNDEDSWREYLITGTCQSCQDKVFGDGEVTAERVS